MTKVYFVRHAKPDFTVKEDLIRPLTQEGINDCKKVTEFLLNKNITKVFSSPYKRAIDTIKDFTDTIGLKINVIADFRERKIDDIWVKDFDKFANKQWNNFDYKLSGGESLSEVQKRNIKAIQDILAENENENIVIGTHGTALSTIINYFDNSFKYEEFKRIKDFMPFIMCITFNGMVFLKTKEFIIE